MAKKTFQDIIPPERRSIRNLSLVKGEEEEVKKVARKKVEKEEVEEKEEIYEKDIWVPEEKNPSKKRVWFLAVLCVAILVVSVVFLISKAEVSITVKKYDIKLDNDLIAFKATTKANELSYSGISLNDSGEISVLASGQKDVASFASGKVVVYNSQAVVQKLVAGTRLVSDSKGLIFKTDSTITIPARKTVSGKVVPGSVEVGVKAEKAGSEYNVGLTDFTIAAFKGDLRSESVYGRSKTSIAGGQIGKIAIVDEALASTTKVRLEQDLTKKMISEARAQVPENFILLDDAFKIVFVKEDPVLSEKNAIIKETASFTGYIFDKTKLVSYLGALKNVQMETGAEIKIDSSELSVTSIKEEGDKLILHLSGTIHITYEIDPDALKKELQGKSRAEAMKILSGLVAIDKARVTTSPLWSVPNNPDRISIVMNK